MALPTVTALPTAPDRSSDSASQFSSKADAFVAALATFGTELEALAAAVVSESYGYYRGTSSSSVAIGTGSKSFTIDTGLAFQVGDYVLIADSAAPTTNWMVGQVTAYDSGTGALTFDSQSANGSGTKTSWTIALTGEPNDANFSSSPTFTGTPFEDVYTVAASTASLAIVPANGSIWDITLSANCTFTESLASGQGVLLMIDDGTAYTITWPTITWKSNGGAAPSLLTSGYTPILLWKMGSTLYGLRSGDA